MRLTDLYPRGTPLAEVAPDFRGMSVQEWRLRRAEEIHAEYMRSRTKEEIGAAKRNAPINAQRIATPRDSYGMKGV